MKASVKKGQTFVDVIYKHDGDEVLLTTERETEIPKALEAKVKVDTRLVVNGKPVVAKVAAETK